MAIPNMRSWQQVEQPQEEQNKKVLKVHKQAWITKGEKTLYSLFGVGLVAFGIYMVSYSSSTDTLNRELQQLESIVEKQAIVNEGLTLEVSELSQPERITKIAKENGLKIQDAKVKKANAFNN